MNTDTTTGTHGTNGTATTGTGGDAVAEQLAKIRAQRAELAEARERRQLPTEAEQLATEQRLLAEDQALDQLEQEHGRIGEAIQIVRSDAGAVIVRRPHMAVFRRFQDSGDPDTKALDQLVRPCVLFPTKVEFDRVLELQPFMLQRCADAVATLAGVRTEAARKKR